MRGTRGAIGKRGARMPATAVAKSRGSELSAQQKQEQMLKQLQADVAAQRAQAAAKTKNDLTAQRCRDELSSSIGFYGRLFTSLYTAVNAASADYTGILSMKDLPDLADGILEFALDGLTMINPELKCLKLATKTAEMIKGGQERVKQTKEAAEAIKKLMSVVSPNDPNKGEALRMAMVRRFMSKLDGAAEQVGIVFAQAMTDITNWQYNPAGSNVWKDVKQTLKKLELDLYVPQQKPDTNLFTDFFLYDMLASYVKANVELEYNTNSIHFPGGDMTHLAPQDHYFDEAGGKYVRVDGLSEAGCATIYERFGTKSENADSLRQTRRYAVARPGDLVTVWGAAYFRNDRRQALVNGGWVNK